MNDNKWIVSKKKEIIEIDDPTVQRKRAVLTISEVDARILQRERAQAKHSDKIDEFRYIAESEYATSAPDYLATAGAVFCFDVSAAYMSWDLSLPSVPSAAVIGISVVSSGLLAVAGHGFSRMALVRPHNVRKTVRNHHHAAFLFGSVAVASGIWVLASRFVPPDWAGKLLAVNWIPFLGINVAGPATAGVLSSIAFLLMRPRWHKARRDRAVETVAALKDFRSWLGKVGGPEDPNHDESASAALSKTNWTSLTNLCLLLAFLVAGVLGGATTTQAGENACATLIDESASLKPEERNLAVAFLKETLSDFVETFDCAPWLAVGRFTNEGAWAKKEWIRIPDKPSSEDCTTAQPDTLTGVNASVFEKFPNVRKYLRNKATGECQERLAEDRGRYESEGIRFIEAFQEHLEVTAPKAGSRTAIGNLTRHLVASGRFRCILLVTDGLDSSSLTPPRITLPDDVTLIMVLGSPDPKYGTPAQVLNAADTWRRAVPGIRIVLTADLYPGMWGDLAEVP